MIEIEVGNKESVQQAMSEIRKIFNQDSDAAPIVKINGEKFECEHHSNFGDGIFFTSLERKIVDGDPEVDPCLYPGYEFVHIRDLMDGVAVHSVEAFTKMFINGTYRVA